MIPRVTEDCDAVREFKQAIYSDGGFTGAEDFNTIYDNFVTEHAPNCPACSDPKSYLPEDEG